jgi:hypothetical protein
MKRWLVLSLIVLASGCSGHASLRASSGGGAPPGGSVGVDVRSTSAAGALIGLGVVAVAIHGSGEGYSRSRVSPLGFEPLAPPMDPARVVREADCTRPIEDFSANLRCR